MEAGERRLWKTEGGEGGSGEEEGLVLEEDIWGVKEGLLQWRVEVEEGMRRGTEEEETHKGVGVLTGDEEVHPPERKGVLHP